MYSEGGIKEVVNGKLNEAEMWIVPYSCWDRSLQIVDCQGQDGQPGKVPKRRWDGSGDAVVYQP